MATFKAFINPIPKRDGTHSVMIRITINRKHSSLAVGFCVLKNQWNDSAKLGKYVRSIHPISEDLNKRIQDEINTLQKLNLEKKPASASELKHLRTSGQKDQEDFVAYAEEYLERVQLAKSIATYRKRKATISKIKEFLGKRKLTFQQMDVGFLTDFEKFLYSKENGVNTVGNHLRIIRTILYAAIRENKFDQGRNPFFRFSVKSKKANKDRLTIEEIEAIEQLKLIPYSLIWHTRNIFLFSFYCHGMRSGDILRLRWSAIKGDRVEYTMGKTKTRRSIMLTSKANNLIQTYRCESLNEFVFPFLKAGTDDGSELQLFNRVSAKNALINKYLKKLAKKATINKNLSFHISRHSFASIAMHLTKDLSSIQKALGHSSIKITEVYLNSLTDEKLDDFTLRVYGSK